MRVGLWRLVPVDAWREKTGRTEAEYHEEVQRLLGAQRPLWGRRWDFDDEAEVRRRFPRLARMYLEGPRPDGK
jgi:hypothetical protein